MRTIGLSHLAQGLFAGVSALSRLALLFTLFACSSQKKAPPKNVASAPVEKPATAPAQAFPEYVAAGQKLLTSGHPQEASLWLFRAYERGAREPVLRQLLADAMRQSAQLPARLPGEHVWDVSLSRDGKLVVLINDKSQIALYDAETGRLLQTLADPREDNEGDVSEVMFLPDRRILSLHRHEVNIQDILVWHQPNSGKPFVNQYVIEPAAIYGGYQEHVMLSPDLHYLLLHAPGNWEDAQWVELLLYDLNTGKPIRKKAISGAKYGEGCNPCPNAGVLSQDGSRILVLEGRKTEHTDPETGEVTEDFGKASVAKIAETATGKLIKQIRDRGTFIKQAQLARDLQRLLTLNERGEVKVWRMDTGQPLFVLDLQKVLSKSKKTRADSAQYTPDGRLIAVHLGSVGLVHWEAETGACASTKCGADSSPQDEDRPYVEGLADDVAVDALSEPRQRALPQLDGSKANGRTLVISSGTAVVKKDPVAPEDRSPESRPPEQIAAWLKCHVPFQLVGDTLTALPPTQPLPGECWPR